MADLPGADLKVHAGAGRHRRSGFLLRRLCDPPPKHACDKRWVARRHVRPRGRMTDDISRRDRRTVKKAEGSAANNSRSAKICRAMLAQP
jgi:hypothetical protein